MKMSKNKIKQMMMIFVVLMVLLGTLIGCASEKSKTYTFTGTVAEMTELNKEMEGIQVDYNITLTDFLPTDKAFDSYNQQYAFGSNERQIAITPQTIFFADGARQRFIRKLSKGDHIKFQVMIVNDHVLDTVYLDVQN